jgi:hypothetical protein
MKRNRFGLFCLMVGLASAACSSSSGATVSCDTADGTVQYCNEFSDLTSAEQSSVKESCSTGQGIVGTSCSRSGVIGTCAVTDGPGSGLDYTMFIYAGSANTTVAEGNQFCQSTSGTWEAGS